MDRITRIRIRNVRVITCVDLGLSPFTVLIGDNGAGKSTIIECLEVLRKAAGTSFFEQLYSVHGGLEGLLRKNAPALELGVVIEDDAEEEPRIEYSFSLRPQGAGAVVHGERMLVGPMKNPLVALRRTASGGEMFDQTQGKLVPVPLEATGPDQLVLGSFGSLPPQKAIERTLRVLKGVEVHLGFDTLAGWAGNSLQRLSTIRGSSMLHPADRLGLLGQNLSNAWFALKNRDEAHWRQTMALVRLGLGDSVDSVATVPYAGGGHVGIALNRKHLSQPIPGAYLSDGELSWLSFVALARLNERRSFLAIDEPELHLHPSLLGRVVSLLASLDDGVPVLISTHSDRVLELLEDPVSAVRICSLEGSEATVSMLDAAELPRWLEEFGDVGQLRASGYLHRLYAPAQPNDGEAEE